MPPRRESTSSCGRGRRRWSPVRSTSWSWCRPQGRSPGTHPGRNRPCGTGSCRRTSGCWRPCRCSNPRLPGRSPAWRACRSVSSPTASADCAGSGGSRISTVGGVARPCRAESSYRAGVGADREHAKAPPGAAEGAAERAVEGAAEGLPEAMAEVLAAYERHLVAERDLTPHSVRAYLGDVAALLAHAAALGHEDAAGLDLRTLRSWLARQQTLGAARTSVARRRSEERRVGKECRSRWSPYH